MRIAPIALLCLCGFLVRATAVLAQEDFPPLESLARLHDPRASSDYAFVRCAAFFKAWGEFTDVPYDTQEKRDARLVLSKRLASRAVDLRSVAQNNGRGGPRDPFVGLVSADVDAFAAVYTARMKHNYETTEKVTGLDSLVRDDMTECWHLVERGYLN